MEPITINLPDRLASEFKEAANKIGLLAEDLIEGIRGKHGGQSYTFDTWRTGVCT